MRLITLGERIMNMKPLTDEQKVIVEENRWLAISIANEMTECTLDLDDRKQAGIVGLMKAVQKHDSSLGMLSTYAKYWIISEIRRAESRDKTIWVPEHMRYDFANPRSAAAREKYGQQAEEAGNVSSFSVREFDMAWVDDDPIEDILESERVSAIKEAVHEAIRSLGRHEQKLIRLRMFEGKTLLEIGKKYDLHKDTVAYKIKSIMGKLKRHPSLGKVA